MHVTNPIAFWLLLLIPILILIHNLRKKQIVVEVTNLFLWQQILRERKKGIHLQRIIINNLPLILQIIMILLAVLTLSKPVTMVESKTQRDVILIIDTSASMKTTHKSGIRFDYARKKALTLVDDLSADGKMLIIESASRSNVQSLFNNDKAELKKIIKTIQPTDEAGKPEKAMYQALSFMGSSQNDQVIFITDGAGDSLEKINAIYEKTIPIVISDHSNNIGITKFEFRQDLDFKDHYEMMLEVKNYNPNPVSVPVELFLDDTKMFEKKIELSPGEKKLIIFPYSGLIAGIVRANIPLDDDFPVDNTAFSILNESGDIWVLLVSKGNFFLEKVLKAYPNVMMNTVNEIDPSSWDEQTSRHDLVIIDRMDFPPTSRGNLLIIDAYSSTLPFTKIDTINYPQTLDWDRKHPITINLDFQDLAIKTASRIKLERTIHPLIESSQTGLLYEFQEENLRVVFLGFDLNQSNLPLKIAFPVMIGNIFQWLYPDTLRFSTAQTKAGEAFPIYLSPTTDSFSIGPPKGKWKRYQATDNPFSFRATNETGIYRIDEGEKVRLFAVNLVDEQESDIGSPITESTMMGIKKEEEPEALYIEPLLHEKPIWAIFLFLVPLIAILEWYVWCNNRGG